MVQPDNLATIIICEDIGLSASYKRTIDFPSKAEQNSWFIRKYNSVNHKSFTAAYNKINNNLVLPIPLEEAYRYSYALVTFPNEEPEIDNVMYCFIIDCSAVDYENTLFTLEIDYFQTFMFDFDIDVSHVTRAHVNRWKDNEIIYNTPTQEGIIAYDRMLESTPYQYTELKYGEYNQYSVAIAWIYLVYTETLDNYETVVRAFFPVSVVETRDVIILPIGGGLGAQDKKFITMDDISDNSYLSKLKIAPEDVISVSFLPWIIDESLFTTTSEDVHSIGGYNYYLYIDMTASSSLIGFKNWTTDSEIKYVYYYFKEGMLNPELFTRKYTYNLSNYCRQPTSLTQTTSYIYEPKMFMEPYHKVVISNSMGDGSFVIPSYKTANKQSIDIYVHLLLSTYSTQILVSTENDVIEGNLEGSSTVFNALDFDIVNDYWSTYALTQKDTDRQIVVNNSINDAINNILFTTYGGTLVASRSASGYDDPQKHGKTASGLFPKFNPSVIGAIGLAAATGVASSIVNSHYAWQNQLLSETKIKNKPNGLLKLATGQNLFDTRLNYITLSEIRCDEVNFKRAFNNFRYYGYSINEFMKPNCFCQSGKDDNCRYFFNYILTNGAIITGSLNQAIKNKLASIFDAGITIFHYNELNDFISTGLDYPAIENIERSLL